MEMKCKNIDHIVITTQDLKACLHFYVDILGMELDPRNGRYAVRFGSQKFKRIPNPKDMDQCDELIHVFSSSTGEALELELTTPGERVLFCR